MRIRALSRVRLIGIVAGVLAGCLVFSACSSRSGTVSEQPQEGEKLAGSFDELLRQNLAAEENPFVIDVLTEAIETGRITQAQYDQAHRMYTDCMVNAGYEEEYSRSSSGLYDWVSAGEGVETREEYEDYSETRDECSDELAPVEALYSVQQDNPDLLARGEEIVVACFKKAQLVDATYKPSDLLSELDDGFDGAPYDPMSAEAQACFSAGNFGVAIGEE